MKKKWLTCLELRYRCEDDFQNIYWSTLESCSPFGSAKKIEWERGSIYIFGLFSRFVFFSPFSHLNLYYTNEIRRVFYTRPSYSNSARIELLELIRISKVRVISLLELLEIMSKFKEFRESISKKLVRRVQKRGSLLHLHVQIKFPLNE